MEVNVRNFKVWEEHNEYLQGISRNLNKVDGSIDVVEVSVEYLSFWVDSSDYKVLDWHGWRPFAGNNVDLILRCWEAIHGALVLHTVVFKH